MANLLSDETFELHDAAARRVMGMAPNNPLRPPLVPGGGAGVQRAVLITSGTASSGRYPAKLQYRDEATPTWSDFSPSIECWAIGYQGEPLQNAVRYDGELKSVHTDGKAVFACVSSVAGGAWAYCVDTTPTSGRYDARLMTVNSDGTLTDPGAGNSQIWLRDANGTGALISGEIYECHRTGTASGREVYTCADYNLRVVNQSLTGYDRVFRVEFGPDNCWNITQPATRRALVKRILTVNEGATEKTTFTHTFTFDATDFDLTGSDGTATIATSGFDGCEQIVTSVSCSGSTLTVVSKEFCWTNGLLKTVDSSSGSGGESTGYQSVQNVIGIQSFIQGIIQAVSGVSAPATLGAWGIGKDNAQMVLAGQIFGW